MDLVSLDTAPDGHTRWEFDSEPRLTAIESAFDVRYTPSLGMHCTARRALLPGDPVLLEPPLVSTRTATAAGMPSAEPEWVLVHALLTVGKRRRWAQQYASLAGAAQPGADAVCGWLSETHGVAADEPALLWQAVRGNAFGLETPLLGVECGQPAEAVLVVPQLATRAALERTLTPWLGCSALTGGAPQPLRPRWPHIVAALP